MSGGHVNIPLILRTVTGSGRQLGAQHSQNIEGHYAMTPGLKVLAPATPADAKGMLLAAYDDKNPIFFAEHFDLYSTRGEVPEEPLRVPLGKAAIARKGSDITLIGYSRMTLTCLRAAELLAEQQISAEVIDLRSLRPLDMETLLASVRKTRHAVLVEEAAKGTSIGGDIIGELQESAFHDISMPIRWIAGAPVPMPYNRRLEQLAIPNPEVVADAASEMLAGSRRRAA